MLGPFGRLLGPFGRLLGPFGRRPGPSIVCDRTKQRGVGENLRVGDVHLVALEYERSLECVEVDIVVGFVALELRRYVAERLFDGVAIDVVGLELEEADVLADVDLDVCGILVLVLVLSLVLV